MKKRTSIRVLVLSIAMCQLPLLFSSCKNDGNNFDASGTFEATETIVSAEANGVIKAFTINEGQTLDSGIMIGYIDTTQLYLKKKQLGAQVKAMGYKLPDIAEQTAPFKQQAAVTQGRLDYLLKEKNRIENLVKADAATPKQLDDINAQIVETQQQIKVINQQGAAQKSALNTQRSGISGAIAPLYIQIEQVNDQLKK
jgi:HlyD family secretion protein